MSDYVGVILAAGRGRRMGSLGEDYPKALLPVANEPLIGHHLKLMRDLGIEEVYIVLGHRGTDIVRALGDGRGYGVTLHYVEQGARLGSAHALGCVRPYVLNPFLLILGDYYFSASDPARLLSRLHQGGGSAIAAKRELDAKLISEACSLQVNAAGLVLNIVEKPAVPATKLKGCGLYALRPEIFDAIARTPRTALRDEYELSISLDLYVKAGNRLYAEEIIIWDINVTRPDDLLECNLKWLEKEGRNKLVAEEAYIADGTLLEYTVVGSYARVTRTSSLQDVVVFPGAGLELGGTIQRALVTPKAYISCGRST